MKVTIIAGLPGSGKTVLAQQICQQDSNSLVLDDVELVKLQTIQPPENITHLILTHPAFCLEKARDKLETALKEKYTNLIIDWIFFANEPDICLTNAKERNDGRTVAVDINSFSRRYIIPEQYQPIDCYRSSTQLDIKI